MKTPESIETNKRKGEQQQLTTEFLHEHHEHNDHQAMTRLSGEYTDGIREMYASMHRTGVTFYKLMTHTKNPPEGFHMTADEASAFVDAWIFFQLANAAYEQEELLKKEQEELKEAERRAGVWLEVDQLAHSVPGLEITATQKTEYGWDVDDYDEKEVTRFDVKLVVPYYGANDLYTVDEVLEAVKEAVRLYNQHLQECEAVEKSNDQYHSERYIKNCKDFLKAHRAFVKQQKHREEVVSAEVSTVARSTIE